VLLEQVIAIRQLITRGISPEEHTAIMDSLVRTRDGLV
jgi:hypothetical protein